MEPLLFFYINDLPNVTISMNLSDNHKKYYLWMIKV